jgi:hypothetical protein
MDEGNRRHADKGEQNCAARVEHAPAHKIMEGRVRTFEGPTIP